MHASSVSDKILRKSLGNSEPKTAKTKRAKQNQKRPKTDIISFLRLNLHFHRVIISSVLSLLAERQGHRKRIVLLELHRLQLCLYALPSFGIRLRFHSLRRKSLGVSVEALGAGGDVWLRGEDVIARLAFKVSLAL